MDLCSTKWDESLSVTNALWSASDDPRLAAGHPSLVAHVVPWLGGRTKHLELFRPNGSKQFTRRWIEKTWSCLGCRRGFEAWPKWLAELPAVHKGAARAISRKIEQESLRAQRMEVLVFGVGSLDVHTTTTSCFNQPSRDASRFPIPQPATF